MKHLGNPLQLSNKNFQNFTLRTRCLCTLGVLIRLKSNLPMPDTDNLRPQVLTCLLLQLYLSVLVGGEGRKVVERILYCGESGAS